MSSTGWELRFVQVDVFTDRVFGGNPLAVFLDGEGLSPGQMQSIAREMNLSETVFLLPAERDDCDIRLRIFTPGRELPFAGHPTIGTAWVLREHGIRSPDQGRIVLEEGIGPVPVRFDGDMIWMTHGPATFGPESDDHERAVTAGILGLTEADLLPDVPIQVGTTGNPFLFVALRDIETVDRVSLDHRAYAALLAGREPVGVFVFAVRAGANPSRLYSRMLPGRQAGIVEDPATGSASGPLGAFVVTHGLVPPADIVQIVSEQGVKMGRPSTVHITVRPADGAIFVGGAVVPVLTGTLTMPATRVSSVAG